MTSPSKGSVILYAIISWFLKIFCSISVPGPKSLTTPDLFYLHCSLNIMHHVINKLTFILAQAGCQTLLNGMKWTTAQYNYAESLTEQAIHRILTTKSDKSECSVTDSPLHAL